MFVILKLLRRVNWISIFMTMYMYLKSRSFFDLSSRSLRVYQFQTGSDPKPLGQLKCMWSLHESSGPKPYQNSRGLMTKVSAMAIICPSEPNDQHHWNSTYSIRHPNTTTFVKMVHATIFWVAVWFYYSRFLLSFVMFLILMCFVFCLSLWSPRIWRENCSICFSCVCLFILCALLSVLVSWVGYGFWLWHSMDISLNLFVWDSLYVYISLFYDHHQILHCTQQNMRKLLYTVK